MTSLLLLYDKFLHNCPLSPGPGLGFVQSISLPSKYNHFQTVMLVNSYASTPGNMMYVHS